MYNNVYAAWNSFLENKVNLDPDIVKRARSSREFLVKQIDGFPEKAIDFPEIFKLENDVQMGSFSRRTKIRELDDIDFLIVFAGKSSTYNEDYSYITIDVPETATTLRKYCDNGKLNSRKILSKIKSSLSLVPQYEYAVENSLRWNKEAVTLKLKSYTWNFDIVPCFLTSNDVLGNSYYLIPDGNGNWKKTDPRIDAKRLTEINQRHDGDLLDIIRLIKYWNKRPTHPKMGSYLLENMAINYFEYAPKITSQVFAFKNLLYNLETQVNSPCMDPKGIQGNLNGLSMDEKLKISATARNAADNATNAIKYGVDGDHKRAINEWRKVFGDGFPEYCN
ncbi:hypothetical protein [Paenibacillus sp. FSL F4-0097]|uniref:hypothetical protein n=1 Tax=Paenibacillus sp. FSL F4-0097 TaxID=2921369 RepID=UPI003159675A